MSGLDKELEAAYAAQQKRQKSLEESKRELEAVSAQGARMAGRTRAVVLVLVALAATVGAGVLLIDPQSRAWGLMLLFLVAVGGLWSFYRNWRK